MVERISGAPKPALNRRLTDVISDVLFRAVEQGDTATAGLLQQALEQRLAFEQAGPQVDRRVQTDPRLTAARQVILSTTTIRYET